MTARLLIGPSGSEHVISEDSSASTATAGATTVGLYLENPWVDVTRDRNGYSFTLVIAIEGDTVANKDTARDAIYAQLNREFVDLVFEQATGTDRISARTSDGEVIKWVATTRERDGHLATVILVTFTAIVRRQSGGGGSDPVLNPPGLIDEITWDHYQGPEGRSSWTITAVFAGDGTNQAYQLANSWVDDLETTRPSFLAAKYERVEKRTTLNGLTGETRVQVIYSVPTLVLNETTDTPETPDLVRFADYNVQISPNDQVDIAVSSNPLLVIVTGFIILRLDKDQVFDPDDPNPVSPTDAPGKIQEAITALKSRALSANGVDLGDVVEFQRLNTQVQSGARAEFQLVLVVNSGGFIKASQEIKTRRQDRSVIIGDDAGQDWVYPPVQSIRRTATQTINYISIDDQGVPFNRLGPPFKCMDEVGADPDDRIVRAFTLPDESGNMTRQITVYQATIVRFYIGLNDGPGNQGAGVAEGGLGATPGEDSGLGA